MSISAFDNEQVNQVSKLLINDTINGAIKWEPPEYPDVSFSGEHKIKYLHFLIYQKNRDMLCRIEISRAMSKIVLYLDEFYAVKLWKQIDKQIEQSKIQREQLETERLKRILDILEA